ncbi:MAG: ABC transporter ATP-binding protein [Anaerolineales bacterium]|nr:ABC transporter ATP-binding protein [Anaerolineales bacterium]
MARITVENLVKNYGEVKAVRDISFEVADGEFVALLGPSGCGKSSTMRCICGLEEISAGTISFDGKPVNDVRPRDRNVAMAFETYALYPTLDVYENIAFPLRSANWPNERLAAKVKDIVRAMELESILDRLPSELSGGQAQRVGLARALVREPSVFLLDEPISHLDTRQRHRMREFIKHIHNELGYTMIYVTHDQEEAMALADRIVVMHEGAIRQIGTPDEVYNDPPDDFVAGFVGEPPMNFIEGSIARVDGKWVFRAKGQTVALPERWLAVGERLPTQVRLGIRPFYVEPSLDPNAPYDMRGEVFLSENLQDLGIVSIDIEDLRLQVVTAPSFRPARHERISLKFNPSYIRLFDPGSGKAIRPEHI